MSEDAQEAREDSATTELAVRASYIIDGGEFDDPPADWPPYLEWCGSSLNDEIVQTYGPMSDLHREFGDYPEIVANFYRYRLGNAKLIRKIDAQGSWTRADIQLATELLHGSFVYTYRVGGVDPPR